jgi:hypothetical protein
MRLMPPPVLQPFNCEKLLYTDYARLPEAKEKELGVEYVQIMDDFVKYAPFLRITRVSFFALSVSVPHPWKSLPLGPLERNHRVAVLPVLDDHSAKFAPGINDG